MPENIVQYRIVNIKKETDDVFTLKLSLDNLLFSHKAGQIITIYFLEINKNKGKEYSISSAPSQNQSEISITVKRVGLFSGLIIEKKVGDVLLGSLPYGYFYTESQDADQILIAGGIGVAPFRSMIVESLRLKPKRKIKLFYSNKKLKDIVFRDEFDNLAKEYKTVFSVHYYLTKENDLVENMKYGHIKVEEILDCGKFYNTEFFICGSMDFVCSYHNFLTSGGISSGNIFTEEFF